MLSLDDFAQTPFFTAIELFSVVLAANIVQMVVSHWNNFPTGACARKVNSTYHRIKFWLKNIGRFPRPAVDMRRSWSVKRAEIPFKYEASLPQNVFIQVLPMFTNWGPVLLVNTLLYGKPALVCPFEIPYVLRSLLQYGLPPHLDADNHIISAYGLYFLLNMCIDLFAAVVPMPTKRKEFFGPSSNFKNFSDLLVTEKHVWELENAEDELLAMIDRKLKH